MNSTQLRCQRCNGITEINNENDRLIKFCKYCGSTELIEESTDVVCERIKNRRIKDVEFAKQQTYKDVELGKQEFEIKKRKSTTEFELG